jgi:protein involved in polysaccharide export with SLBB domain
LTPSRPSRRDRAPRLPAFLLAGALLFGAFGAPAAELHAQVTTQPPTQVPTPAELEARIPTPAPASATRSAGYLMPGDRVVIQVWRQPEFSGEFYVTEQGVIGHPILRNIRVAWRDVEEVQPLIREFLLEFEQDPNVVVETFFRVSVAGEVRQPNVQYLRPGTTLAQAVALAGGTTDRARNDRVILRRAGRDYELNLGDPALPQRNWVVYSGDEILVARRVSFFREYLLPAISVAGSIASLYRVFQ